MSERNGDRARFRKLQIRKLRYRTHVREMLQKLAAKTAPVTRAGASRSQVST